MAPPPSFTLSLVNTLLHDRHFGALLRSLATEEARPLAQDGVLDFVEFAYRLSQLDFVAAEQTLGRAIDFATVEERAALRYWLSELGEINRLARRYPRDEADEWDGWLAVQRTLLHLLFLDLSMKYLHQSYADFLVRVYRYQEATLRYLVELDHRVPTQMAQKARFVQFVEEHPKLQRFLQWNHIYHQRGPQLDALQCLIEYRLNLERESYQFKVTYELLEKTRTLRDLEDRAFLFRGFEGVGAETIRRVFGEDVLKDFRLSQEELGIDLSRDPFRDVEGVIAPRWGTANPA